MLKTPFSLSWQNLYRWWQRSEGLVQNFLYKIICLFSFVISVKCFILIFPSSPAVQRICMYTIRFECSCLPQLPFVVNNLLEVMGPGDIGTDTGYYAQAPFPPPLLCLPAYLTSDDIKGPADWEWRHYNNFGMIIFLLISFYVEEQLCMDNGLSMIRNGKVFSIALLQHHWIKY